MGKTEWKSAGRHRSGICSRHAPCHGPDHLIAVSTIVSRQRSIGQAGAIGALWGVGHTITIFRVGAAIILFNIVIPPRIGLMMELAVGLDADPAGILNLTGVTQRITHRYTPQHGHTDEILAQRSDHSVIHSHPHQHHGVLTNMFMATAPEVHMHLAPMGHLR